MRSSPSWRPATTILGATCGRPRAKISCAKSTPPDARSPLALPNATLFPIHHTSAREREGTMFAASTDRDAFWQAFRHQLGLDDDNYVVGSFGDSPDMATELAHLVIAGIKRATARLARDYGDGREPTPKPGDFVMILDGAGRPRFIWRTIEV